MRPRELHVAPVHRFCRVPQLDGEALPASECLIGEIEQARVSLQPALDDHDTAASNRVHCACTYRMRLAAQSRHLIPWRVRVENLRVALRLTLPGWPVWLVASE